MLDTNVLIDYLLYCALDSGGYDRGLLRESNIAPYEIKAYIDGKIRSGSIRVPNTAYREMGNVVQRIIRMHTGAQRISLIESAIITVHVMKHAAGLPVGLRCPDDWSMREPAEDVYRRAWDDPGSLALRERWAHVKHGRAGRWRRGPPGGADIRILSTAAALARKRRVCLLTGDHDFIVFRREIMDGLGVEVVDPWHPDRWPA